MSSGPMGETRSREEGQRGGVGLTLAFPVHKGCSGDGQSLCKAEQPRGLSGSSSWEPAAVWVLQHKDVPGTSLSLRHLPVPFPIRGK